MIRFTISVEVVNENGITTLKVGLVGEPKKEFDLEQPWREDKFHDFVENAAGMRISEDVNSLVHLFVLRKVIEGVNEFKGALDTNLPKV